MGQLRVTVFGGTGFVGQAVVRRLAASGARVRVAARRPRAVEFTDVAPRVEARRVDIRHDADVAEALRECDAAVNAVGLYVERRGFDFEGIHVEGAARIARLARDMGVAGLVQMSGIGVDPASPSRYVSARARGEERVRAAFPAAVILRPSVIFGRGDAFLTTLAGVCRLPVVPLFGDGSMRMQPVWVEDVAQAIERALASPDPAGRLLELGGREVLAYGDILRAVMQQLGVRRPLLPVPFAVWRMLAAICSVLPSPPLTRDQIVLMESDNVVDPDAAGFADLGIEPDGLRERLPDCLPGTVERVRQT